ncbi:unnamed protein product [Rhodiola kirilowii]
MVNGAFFVSSGARLNTDYAPASSFQPKSVAYINQFTVNVGVMGDSRWLSGIQVKTNGSQLLSHSYKEEHFCCKKTAGIFQN